MKITLGKEQIAKIGEAGVKIGMAIIIEGTKSVVAKGTTKMIMEGFDNGIAGVKNMSLDDILGKKSDNETVKVKKEKKGFFRKKKDIITQEEHIEAVSEAFSDGLEAGVNINNPEA